VKNHNRTVVMVTHEQNELKQFLDKVILLERGEKGCLKARRRLGE